MNIYIILLKINFVESVENAESIFRSKFRKLFSKKISEAADTQVVSMFKTLIIAHCFNFKGDFMVGRKLLIIETKSHVYLRSGHHLLCHRVLLQLFAAID